MKTTKDLALIGAGHWGKNLARNFNDLSVLHTICDVRSDSLKDYAITYPGITLTTNFEEVLQNQEITKVVIATPAVQHFAMAKKALLAGKDVYVEKPLCLDTKEAVELIALSKAKQKILMVGHILQYHPAIIKLQEMLKCGFFGKLQYIASHRLSPGQVRNEENNLWSFAPHDISVILSLMRNLPSSVRCTGHAALLEQIPDICMTTLSFPQGGKAHIYTSWLHPFKEQKLVVVGASSTAVFDDTKPWDEKLLVYKDPIKWENGCIPKAQKVEGEKIVLPQNEPLKSECQHFLECCLERTSPKTDGEEALRVLRVLKAAQQSMDLQGEERHISENDADYFSHPTAIIDPGATIGKDSKIWHFSHIMDKAIVGDRCNIGQNVVISPDVVIGNNVKIQNNVSVYTGVVCEDDVFLGPSMVFTNVLNPRSQINRRGEYRSSIVRQGATIGANATIVCGIELGAFCFIGAGAVVTKDVKPFALIVGNPGKQIGWVSRAGERLDLPLSVNDDNEELIAKCPLTDEAYVLSADGLKAHESIQELVH